METAAQLAVRLTSASRRKSWDVFNLLEWPEKLSDMWCMPPELVSLYGTPVWDTLDIDQQKRLALYECCNFFSLVLQGERPLVQGLVHRYHQKGNPREITDYLLHFVDEENKHMMMFGEFCNRYIGKVYPEKKIALTRQWAKGEGMPASSRPACWQSRSEVTWRCILILPTPCWRSIIRDAQRAKTIPREPAWLVGVVEG